MKTVKLDDYLLWNDELARVVGLSDGKHVIIEMLKSKACPHCGGDLGPEQKVFNISSPLFQNGAKPIETIKEN